MKSEKPKKATESKEDVTKSPSQQSGDKPSTETEDVHNLLSEIQRRQIELELQKTELSRIRQELQESRNKYLVLYDFAPAGYLTLNETGIILEANLTIAELLGREKSGIIGSEFILHIIPESRSVFVSHLKEVFSSGTRQSCEIRMRERNGIISHVRLDSIAIRDAQGQLSQCNTTVLDITSRKKYEEVDQYQATVASISHDAIVATDRDLIITNWNKAAENMFGWQAEEVLRKQASTQIRTKILDVLTNEEAMRCISENGSWTGETVSLKKDGSKLNTLVSIGVIWDSAGNFNGIVAIYHEITNRTAKDIPSNISSNKEIELIVKERTEGLVKANRLLQQEISLHKQTALLAKESEGKNRDLVDNIKLGIFRCTPGLKGRYLEVNGAMEEITGYSRDELLQMDVCKLYAGIQENQSFSHEVNIADWKVIKELRLKKKNGEQIIVSETVVAIRFDSGIIQYFDGILEDITERKQAQMQVQQSLERLQKTIKEIIQAMAYIGEVRDPYTAGHQRRVAQLSIEIAKSMGLNHEQFEGLTMAAFVHDIGKILVPADILSKPGKLTRPESEIIKDHTRIGYEILKNIEFPWPIAKIVLQHHERMDGSGYPSGILGEQIVLEARILAVADVVEAMSSHRPYRPALGIDKALSEINLNRGTLYDPAVVDACVSLFTDKGFNLN